MWHLATQPFPAQDEGLRLSEGRDDFAYFMEMGLGKTATTLADFVRECINDNVRGLVVVCPNSLKRNWVLDAEKHGAKANFYVWPDVPKDPTALKVPFVLTINYEAIGVGKGEEYLEAVFKQHQTMFALDESVAIKDPKSLRSKACLRLGKLARMRRLLSGAPMVQGPHDLWSQLHFLNAIPGFKYYPFRYTFCKLGGYMGKQVVGTQNEDRLYQIVNSVAFRAKKQDWLEGLPPKLPPEDRHVPLTKAQAEAYEELDRDLCTYILESDAEVSAEIVLTKLLRLRQILSGFVMDDEGNLVWLKGGTKRVAETKDIVEQAGKVVIYAYFNPSIELLLDELKKFNPVSLRGKQFTNEDEVEENKRRFNEDPDCKAIVCQVSAAKYGHTLVGSEKGGFCSVGTYFENSYSLDDRIQSEDRIHRIGQPNSVKYIDFVSSPTDRAIVAALQKKQSIADAIIDGVQKGEIGKT